MRDWKGRGVALNAEVPEDLRKAFGIAAKNRGTKIKDAALEAFVMWLDWAETGGDPRPPVENVTDEEAEMLRFVLHHYRDLPDERRKMFVDWLKLWAGIG